MHRPLEGSCTLQLLNFRMNDPTVVNQVFWRSCSFLLGAVMQRTFKESAGLFLHSFPKPSIKSGSFVHDIALNDPSWTPTEHDLHTLGIEMVKLSSENLKIERLDVSHEIALEMFRDNPFKREQLPSISNQNNGIVTLYRVGEHIDISGGPMMASSGFVERIKIASTHKVSTPEDSCHLYRVQGVALPKTFRIGAFAFSILVDRAKKLVSSIIPQSIQSMNSNVFPNRTKSVTRAQKCNPMIITWIRSCNKVLISNPIVTFLLVEELKLNHSAENIILGGVSR